MDWSQLPSQTIKPEKQCQNATLSHPPHPKRPNFLGNSEEAAPRGNLRTAVGLTATILAALNKIRQLHRHLVLRYLAPCFFPIVVLGRTKINQFYNLICINKNVFILDITMHYAVHVQIGDSRDNLEHMLNVEV